MKSLNYDPSPLVTDWMDVSNENITKNIKTEKKLLRTKGGYKLWVHEKVSIFLFLSIASTSLSSSRAGIKKLKLIRQASTMFRSVFCVCDNVVVFLLFVYVDFCLFLRFFSCQYFHLFCIGLHFFACVSFFSQFYFFY